MDKYNWKEIGDMEFSLNDNEGDCLVVLSYDKRTDLWELESNIEKSFNTILLNPLNLKGLKGEDIKQVALDFVVLQCDNMCSYYNSIKDKLISHNNYDLSERK